MAPRPDVSEERTQQILDAAMVVFAQSGFHEARMDDIADEAGLSKGTLYWYFDSKDDIILAILKWLFDVELEDLQALLMADEPANRRLLAFTQRFVDEAERLSDLLPMAYEFYAAAGREQRVRSFLQRYFQAYRDLLADLIQQGITRGEFRDVDTRDVATTIVGLYEGLVLLWIADPETVPLREQAVKSVELLLDGVRAGDR